MNLLKLPSRDDFNEYQNHISQRMTKPTIAYCAHSEDLEQPGQSLLCTKWVAKDPSFLHANSKDSDKTGWMPKLICLL